MYRTLERRPSWDGIARCAVLVLLRHERCHSSLAHCLQSVTAVLAFAVP